MEYGGEDNAPAVTFTMYAPYTEAQYSVILDIDSDFDIKYYHTVESLLKHEGIDSPYIEEQIPLFDDLFAN